MRFEETAKGRRRCFTGKLGKRKNDFQQQFAKNIKTIHPFSGGSKAEGRWRVPDHCARRAESFLPPHFR